MGHNPTLVPMWPHVGSGSIQSVAWLRHHAININLARTERQQGGQYMILSQTLTKKQAQLRLNKLEPGTVF